MYIYVLQNDYLRSNNLIKIGKTYDLAKRLNQHNNNSYPNHKLLYHIKLNYKLYNFAELYIFELVNDFICNSKNIKKKSCKVNDKEEFNISLKDFECVFEYFKKSVYLAYKIKMIYNKFKYNKKIKLYTKNLIDDRFIIFKDVFTKIKYLIHKESGYINASKVLNIINKNFTNNETN